MRFNAGKESVAIDLAHPQARSVVLDLARAADVLVENFVPGVMARHGLDYGAVSAVNPAIVYCSISGYGQTGPLRDRPAFAHLINAASGAMDLDRQGDPEPRVAYLQSADALAGVHAFGLVLAAVLRRQRSGQGAYLDVSMLQSLWGAEDIGIAAALNGGDLIKGPRPGMIIHAIGGRQLAVQFIGGGPTWERLLAAMGAASPASAATLCHAGGQARTLARVAQADLRLARSLRVGGGRGGGADGRARALRARAVDGRGDCAPAHGRTPGILERAASGARRSARDLRPVSRRRRAGARARPGPLSGGGGDSRDPFRHARILGRAH